MTTTKPKKTKPKKKQLTPIEKLMADLQGRATDLEREIDRFRAEKGVDSDTLFDAGKDVLEREIEIELIRDFMDMLVELQYQFAVGEHASDADDAPDADRSFHD